MKSLKESPNPRDIHLPVYNIKAVARMTSLRPVTLRAWERRYGLPSPSRGTQGYRLYSEYDLRTLRWLKFQIDSGLNISRAVDYLVELRSIGRDPAEESVPESIDQPISLEFLCTELMQALLRIDEAAASETMRRAFAIYSIEQVLSGVIEPTMVEIGEGWHRGEIPIAVEHYASQFVIQYLMSMLSASSAVAHRGVIVAGAAPGEMHHIGLLMLSVILRWRGWDVRYLGPDVKLERLEEALGMIHPRMLLFTANRTETANELENLGKVLEKFSEPKPLVVLGGQAFRSVMLSNQLPGVIINGTTTEMVAAIENLLLQNGRSAPI